MSAKIIPFDYEGQPVRFNTEGWINATEAAARFGRRPQHWLDTDQASAYIEETLAELAEERPLEFKSRDSGFLVVVRKGRYGGTWIHPELAVEFARWLSPKFARWCDRQIRNILLTRGMAAQGHEHLIGLLLRLESAEWERRFPPAYYHALAKVTNTRYEGHAGGTPAVFGQITRRWVYQVIMPPDVLLELEERCGTREKLHQWLTDGGARVLDSQLAKLTLMANTSTDLPDFEARCMQAFGLPGQLRIVYPLVG